MIDRDRTGYSTKKHQQVSTKSKEKGAGDQSLLLFAFLTSFLSVSAPKSTALNFGQ